MSGPVLAMCRKLFPLILLTLAVGCSGNNVANEVAVLNSSNIKRVANLYAACQSINGGKGPKDVETIKNLANQLPNQNLEWMGVDRNKLDALFISERDGKPFKIKFGAMHAFASPHIPIVFEEEGIGGSKQVAWTNAQVREVDDAEYQQLWGEAAPPAAGPPLGAAPDSK